jgi:hypothetical protein
MSKTACVAVAPKGHFSFSERVCAPAGRPLREDKKPDDFRDHPAFLVRLKIDRSTIR